MPLGKWKFRKFKTVYSVGYEKMAAVVSRDTAAAFLRVQSVVSLLQGQAMRGEVLSQHTKSVSM